LRSGIRASVAFESGLGIVMDGRERSTTAGFVGTGDDLSRSYDCAPRVCFRCEFAGGAGAGAGGGGSGAVAACGGRRCSGRLTEPTTGAASALAG